MSDVCALIELKKNKEIKIHGDHYIFIFDAISYKSITDKNILTTDDLIKKKIILCFISSTFFTTIFYIFPISFPFLFSIEWSLQTKHIFFLVAVFSFYNLLNFNSICLNIFFFDV